MNLRNRLDFILEGYNNNENKIDIPIYFINLDQDIQRYNDLLRQFKMFNIKNWTKISAISTNNMRKINNINVNCQDMYLKRGEKACLLSHIKALLTSQKNNDEYFIIIEDDVNLETMKLWNFKISDLIKTVDSNFDVIKIYHTKFNNKFNDNSISILSEKDAGVDGTQLTDGSVANIYSAKGRDKILKRLIINDEIYIPASKEYLKRNTIDRLFYLNYYTFITDPSIVLTEIEDFYTSTRTLNDNSYHTKKLNEILDIYENFFR